tara:strand:+ start:276 stop:461 length:186 start_codon:yes stop_codon:yes gene_type:complete
MKITTRYVGKTIVEVIINGPESSITVDVCDLNGFADPEFIESLKGVAKELEDHNEGIELQK